MAEEPGATDEEKEKKAPALRFRHLDDEKWQEVRAQQHGDRRVSIFEKWLEFSPNLLCLYAKWDPGMMVHKHGHNSDHILFVLAIFLASVRTRALIWQISAFTVAHTATLGLAASGVITPSSSLVEPLIAFTIAFVAIENLVFKDMTKWRPAVVFGFGLIHGLGFAGFFGELGLPPGQFWSALIGFNVGVEIGQLSVILVAALLSLGLRRVLRDPAGIAGYRSYVVRPGSALIGLTGLWWGITRLIG